MIIDELAGIMRLEDPVILAFAAIMIAIVTVVIFFVAYYRTVITIASFAYPNAKFKALGTQYVERERVQGLMEASNVQDALAELMREGYNQRATGDGGLVDIETELDRAIARQLLNGYRSLPDGAKPFFRAYLMRVEARHVKDLVRTAATGGDIREAIGSIPPLVHLGADTLGALAEAKDVEELVSALQPTPFGGVLAEAVHMSKDEPVLWELALDRFVLKEMRGSRYRSDIDVSRALASFVGRYADVANIKVAMRTRGCGYPKEALADMLVPFGRELSRWKAEALIEAESIEGVLAELEGTSYGNALRAVASQPGTGGDAFAMERALDAHLLGMAREMSSQDTLTVGPVIHFMLAKEYEARNIRTALRAMTRGREFGEIEHLLVLEGAS